MKPLQIVGLVTLNGLMFLAYYLVQQDLIVRKAYWLSLGFVPSMSYSFLTYTLTATRGSLFIPGLLTFDWSQLALLVAIAADAIALISIVLSRGRDDTRNGQGGQGA